MSSFPPVSRVVPHSGEMVLLDEIIAFDGKSLTARVTVDPGRVPLLGGELVPVCVGLEYVSQGIAAFAGLRDLGGSGAMPGYLVSVRNVECRVATFTSGQELIVRVELETEEGAFGSFHGKIEAIAGATLLAGQFNVYHEAA